MEKILNLLLEHYIITISIILFIWSTRHARTEGTLDDNSGWDI